MALSPAERAAKHVEAVHHALRSEDCQRAIAYAVLAIEARLEDLAERIVTAIEEAVGR